MLRAAWLSMLVAAVLLAGCSARPAQESSSVPPGPHHVVSVQNLGPNDAKLTLTMRLPNGSITRDQATVKANATVKLSQATAANASIEMTLEYSWDEGDHASSGVLDLSYDSTGCAGESDIAVQLYTQAGHSASSSTPATCAA